MVALPVVMFHILLQRSPQRRFSKQDQPRQTLFFDRPHPAFRVRVQIRASCWQSKWIHTSRLDQFSKGWAELRISVVQQIAAAPQASPLLHRDVSRLLLHPLLIRVRRESCQIHAASLQVDEEQHIVGRQPLERQDFRREEVHAHQNVPVCADKVLPGDRLLSLRRWRNAVATENVAHRLIR